MNKKALVILAEGFEETEAAAPIDILRRAEVEVTIAGLGGTSITGAHGIKVNTDIALDDYNFLPDALILPGGMPGAENLANSEKVKTLIQKMVSEKRLIAAICASPALVFAPMGILNGRRATCYPGMENNFSSDIKFVKEKVVQDGNIITSQGPATASSFGLKIAENLVGKDKRDMIANQMLFA
jgi:4-methyl-5(b-hydroxyethyl)-thiazole monophosphate biosynthesis